MAKRRQRKKRPSEGNQSGPIRRAPSLAVGNHATGRTLTFHEDGQGISPAGSHRGAGRREHR